ncbi:hypothetical protein [Allorhodopirellula heiligendammensis]|uniref:Uncharacterized protein n=1 Tax=Allorhodopirellula heiligendammensis TaxID=2714739 RepID=A0A5C6C3U2_9BACT|nr:hypothetical protein [Allorhodopirellula heiligendammensis]TWU19250.1 hypothetical protein Poly21_14220 [Allorhodopirellula heiligendammensis]|tara:strand:- start:1559 stop:1756 length:198 start_codon:yes stop_codon:yes gene_type:complete
MNAIAKMISVIALGAVIVPCLLYFTGSISLDAVKAAALAGTIGWFMATPMWMSRDLPKDAAEVEI